MAQSHSPFYAYWVTSVKADKFETMFEGWFEQEDLPVNGRIRPLEEPGFGLKLSKDLVHFKRPY